MVNYRSQLDSTFAALADPVRRGIVERLSRGEATVGELAEPYRISAPAISRHLRVLQRAGLLEQRKVGRIRRCRLRPQPMTAAQQWLEHHRVFWSERLEALARHFESSSTPARTAKKSVSRTSDSPTRART